MSGASMESPPQLLGDIRHLIEGARQQASVALNAYQTAQYWHIGRRIYTELLAGEQIELLELDASGAHVAKYLDALPSKELLQAKLHEAIALPRARQDQRSGDEA